MFQSKMMSFIRIAELGSFAEAAESLFISPAALSQQIKKLEQELGFELFDRGSRKAKLSAAGKQFLPVAYRLITDYEGAVAQCRLTAELERRHQTRLRAGCLNDDVFVIWPKLLELMREENISDVFPRLARYSSRMELYRALLRKDEDFTILLENEELYSLGLEFHPLKTIPEVCQLFLPPQELLQNDHVAIEDLLQYRVAFHFSAGHTIYEDALRKHLCTLKPGIFLSEPKDFYDTYRENTYSLLLVPGIQYSGDHQYIRPLVWEQGHRLGFVTTRNPKAEIMDYIQQMQSAIQHHPELWVF